MPKKAFRNATLWVNEELRKENNEFFLANYDKNAELATLKFDTFKFWARIWYTICLLYTSDAADE